MDNADDDKATRKRKKEEFVNEVIKVIEDNSNTATIVFCENYNDLNKL